MHISIPKHKKERIKSIEIFLEIGNHHSCQILAI